MYKKPFDDILVIKVFETSKFGVFMVEEKEIVTLFAKLAPSYDLQILKDKDYTAFEKIPKWIVEGNTRSNPKVLDLGCGTGLSSLEFFKMDYKVTGIDLTQEMLLHAKKLPFEELICQTLEKTLPFTEETFDISILLGVMEFIHSPKSLFLEIYRVLKKRGVLGLTIPCKSEEKIEEKLEIFTYAEEDIENLFSQIGFQILRKEAFQGFICRGVTVPYCGYLLQK